MRTIKMLAVILTTLFCVSSQLSSASDQGPFSTVPVKNGEQRWKVGYYEGGAYIDYQKILTETVKGLMKLGWIEPAAIPPQEGEQTDQLWQWLSTEVDSEYIEFVSDAHYSAGWDEVKRKLRAEQVIGRLSNNRDIDLMIAMGTWAGKDLANDRQTTPTMVLSTSDPLSAGIIQSVEYSGYDHLHATVDPNRYDRQIRIFFDVVGFKKLGVAFEDSVNGRSYAAMDILQRLSKSKGFELVGCHTLSDISDISVAEDSVKKCFTELAEKVDAIYVTLQGGVNSNSIPALVKIANKNTFLLFRSRDLRKLNRGFY